MSIFSEQTFIDMYTEIHSHNSHFNQDIQQSSATCQTTEKLQSIISYQQPQQAFN